VLEVTIGDVEYARKSAGLWTLETVDAAGIAGACGGTRNATIAAADGPQEVAGTSDSDQSGEEKSHAHANRARFPYRSL